MDLMRVLWCLWVLWILMMLLLSLLAGGILVRFAKAVLFPAGASTGTAS